VSKFDTAAGNSMRIYLAIFEIVRVPNINTAPV